MKKVLIVDDSWNFQDDYKKSLGDRVTIIRAFTEDDVKRLFLANPDVDLIVMRIFIGACFTLPLIERIRETFKGPMIAAASCPAHRRALMRAGCNHGVSSRLDVVEKVEEILGL